ncbi:hypothetical protein SAMN04487770_13639 [Butyrivibrio sp. ob235]|uniref:hypothetical protein n=1 Tax=Butyrivibrio sp. ob235 TaxID=1761780 RepID=UPI0008D4B291|nr:hypothetical protein [Butyrivibrio sp. ob235]SEM39021.1 hypothetical protein SAMN04487770_13639 [Butyrivibrio sp. ob235]
MGLIRHIRKMNEEALKTRNYLTTGPVGGSVLLDKVLTLIDEGPDFGYIESLKKIKKELQNQADDFLQKKKDCKSNQDEYKRLLDSYEKVIDVLKNKPRKSEAENELLTDFLLAERELKALSE